MNRDIKIGAATLFYNSARGGWIDVHNKVIRDRNKAYKYAEKLDAIIKKNEAKKDV